MFELEGVKELCSKKGKVKAFGTFYALLVEVEHEEYPEKVDRERKWVRGGLGVRVF
jgi:hypothetical protein